MPWFGWVGLVETRMLVDVILLQNPTQEVRLFQTLSPKPLALPTIDPKSPLRITLPK